MPPPAAYASWPLNNNAGNGTWVDSTGGGHPLTGFGSPTDAVGSPATTHAVALNGTTQTLQGSVPVDVTQGFEFAGLVFYNAFGRFDVVAGWQQACIYTETAPTPKQPAFSFTQSNGSQIEVQALDAPPLNGHWYPVQAYYNPTTQRIGIRFNGGNWYTLAATAGVHAPGTFFLGGHVAGSVLYLNGRLQQWSVWQGNLSPSDRDAVLASLGGARPVISLVLGDGNSLMYGAYMPPAYPSSPNNVMATLNTLLLAGPPRESGWTTVNKGVNGRDTEQCLTAAQAGGGAFSYYDPRRADNWIVLWEGHNSLNVGDTPAQAYAVAQAYISAAHAVGFKVALGTVIACGASSRTPTWQAARFVYNALVRANTAGADAVFDPAADARFTDATNATYFQSDLTHLTDTGYEAVAGVVYASLFPPIVPPHLAPNIPKLSYISSIPGGIRSRSARRPWKTPRAWHR